MPPSSAPAASGVCFTAQRTSSSSAMIGIFKNTISQMKVHVFTPSDRIPGWRSSQPCPAAAAAAATAGAAAIQESPLNCVIARSSCMRATISSPVRRSTRSVPNSSTLKEASTVAWAIARRSSSSESSSRGWAAM